MKRFEIITEADARMFDIATSRVAAIPLVVEDGANVQPGRRQREMALSRPKFSGLAEESLGKSMA